MIVPTHEKRAIAADRREVESKPVRRMVVGYDQQSKALAQFDGAATPKVCIPGGTAVLNLWVTDEFPVDLSGSSDKSKRKVGVPLPSNGTILRIVDFPPAGKSSTVFARGARQDVDGYEYRSGNAGVPPDTQIPTEPGASTTPSFLTARSTR
jgi:hypothetical protein